MRPETGHANDPTPHAPLSDHRQGLNNHVLFFSAPPAVIETIKRLATRDKISHATLLGRAIEAYKLFPTLTPDQACSVVRFSVRADDRLKREIEAIVDVDGISRSEFLSRALAAFQVMYPGPDYRPGA